MIKRGVMLVLFLIMINLAYAGYYDYNDVLLVANNQSAVSMNISNYFFTQRNMAYRVNISVIEQETINFTTFNSSIRIPIENYLLQNNLVNQINYIVLTKGIPLRIENPIGSSCFAITHQCASVDSELTLILGKYNTSIGRANAFGNPYSGQEQRFSKAKYDIYLVTRLDAYQNDTNNDNIPDDVKNLIDNAKYPVTNGTFVLDKDPNWGSTGSINNNLELANISLKNKGYNVTFNSNNVYLVNQSNVLGYFSWGSNDYNDNLYCYNSIPNNNYLNGSIGETAVSTSARTFNSTNRNYGQSLIADLIHEGITGVKGYAYEPYASAIANPNILFNRYVDGYNLADSFYMASAYLSWTDVIIGDPKLIIKNDSINPVIILDSPVNNSLISNGTYLNFTISDNIEVQSAWYTFNNTNTTFVNNNYTINTMNWSSGSWNITVYANDSSGNQNNKYLVFEIIANLIGELPVYSNFDGNTTNILRIIDRTNITNLTLEKLNIGRIDFLQKTNVSGLNLNSYIIISENFISLDSNNLKELNVSANLTLNNLKFNYTPVMMKDNSKCSSCVILNYTNGTLKFNVTSFTSYFATSNSNLTIWNEVDAGMPYSGFTKYTNNQTYFFANYSNFTSGELISIANCSIAFSNINDNMTFNSSKNLFEFNRSFSSGGSHSYTIACTSSGFENITLTDSILITSNIVYLFPLNNTVIKTLTIQLNWTNFTVNTLGRNLSYLLEISNTSDFSNIIYNGKDKFVNYTGSPGLVGGIDIRKAHSAISPGPITTNGSDFWIVYNSGSYVYHFNSTGGNVTGSEGLIGGINLNKARSSFSSGGITTNGSDFWIVDVNANYVYHFDAFGNNISGAKGLVGGFSTQVASQSNSIGITTNGSDFWILKTPSNKIYVYHFNSMGDNITGTPGLMGGFAYSQFASSDTHDITMNGSDFWILSTISDFVYHFDAFGSNITDGFDLTKAYPSITNPRGIDTDSRIKNGISKTPNDFWLSDPDSVYIYHFKGVLNEQGLEGNKTQHNVTISLPDQSYYYRIKSYDGNLESDYVYGNFTVNTAVTLPQETPGAGGGGTSIGGSSGGSSNIITETKNLGVMPRDENKVIKFTENKIIDEITINALETGNNVELEVKRYDIIPNVPEIKNAHSYLKIELKNLNNFKAKINFKVEKSWLFNKNFDKEKVSLNRFENGWNKLPTNKVREDLSYVYYESETDKFSYFAITSEEIKEEIPKQINKTEEKIIPKVIEPIITKEQAKNYSLFIILLIITISLVIAYKIKESIKTLEKETKETKIKILKDYVKIYRLKHYTKEEIKEIALKKGWDENIIDEILKDIK
jgi:uncharacterized protein (TIGR03790 family)